MKVHWLLGPVALTFVCGFIGVVFSPAILVKSPLLLVALSPLTRHLVLASPSVEFVPFVAVAIARLFFADPFVYVLGWRYGDRAVRWMEARSASTGRVVRWLELLFHRAWPVAVFVSPGYVVCTLSGAARVPFWRFAAVNLAGTTALVLLVRYVAGAASDWIAIVVRVAEEYLGPLTLLGVLLALGGIFLGRRRLRADVAWVNTFKARGDEKAETR